ncbi:hypothetical protein CSC2_16480 [Clostridium zeae]|uniref:Uncharacterized protein n=1 Tax=Clostridium zeae TaxID=2759022 RepID=A0ABQ1E8K7_9CLOT|nr:hypothetical protein CSC2_16480 [Clostridium zeae]
MKLLKLQKLNLIVGGNRMNDELIVKDIIISVGEAKGYTYEALGKAHDIYKRKT